MATSKYWGSAEYTLTQGGALWNGLDGVSEEAIGPQQKPHPILEYFYVSMML